MGLKVRYPVGRKLGVGGETLVIDATTTMCVIGLARLACNNIKECRTNGDSYGPLQYNNKHYHLISYRGAP